MESETKCIELIDLEEVTKAAESLRPGCNAICPIKLSRDTVVGQGSNFHFPVGFNDGVKWMVRVRRQVWDGPCTAALRINAASEVATLRHMKTNGLAVPQAWLPPKSADAPEQFIYFFEEYAEGRPAPKRKPSDVSPINSQDSTLVDSLARWFCALETVSFPRFGSLHFEDDDESIMVGPFVRKFEDLVMSPFFIKAQPTAKLMYLALIDNMIQQTLDGVRYPADREIEAYLALLEVRSLVAGCDALDSERGYLKHGDDKGDQWMLNDEGCIASVIDWEWSFITCKADAFAPPYAFVDNDFLVKGSNVLNHREQALAYAYEQLDRHDLAECVRKGKKFQHLYHFLRMEKIRANQMRAMRRAFLGEELGELPPPMTKQEYIETLENRFGEDVGLAKLKTRASSKKQDM
nr:uncharacterized protein CI109_007381 [Kwoniella shandongensis]KAA5524289.1 hypothetical protein CI109_007381 [Kwoniella shandongensis]